MILAALATLFLSGSEPKEDAIFIASQTGPLHGSMITPETTRAVAVILPGSGPTNRDGDSPQFGIAARPYKLLSEALADRGVATVRIDKRGIGASAFAAATEEDVRFGDMAADARAWAAEAATRAGQPCAWLIGHSEGALVAQEAAREPDEKICGLVLISGAGRPAAEAVREQLAVQLPAPMLAAVDAAFADLNAGRTTAAIPGLEALLRPSVQPYLISWFALDPAALAAGYPGPMMIVSGSNDLQIPSSEADRLTAAQPHARRLDVEGMNHVMKVAPTDRAGNFATYANPDLPLAPGLADAVADFILTSR